jgi:hypothetical protein
MYVVVQQFNQNLEARSVVASRLRISRHAASAPSPSWCANLVVLPPGPKSPPTKCRDPSPPPKTRRALELLTSCRDGCTEAVMLAHGFTIAQMVALVRAGLATAERVVAGRRTIEVARVRIAEMGRLALAK